MPRARLKASKYNSLAVSLFHAAFNGDIKRATKLLFHIMKEQQLFTHHLQRLIFFILSQKQTYVAYYFKNTLIDIHQIYVVSSRIGWLVKEEAGPREAVTQSKL